MAMSYWKTETPVVKQTLKNEIRVYNGAGKLQVFPRLENTVHGVGKGATLDLAGLSVTELESIRTLFNDAIDAQLESRKECVS